ncbi:MAG: ATP-binding cassette, subfamily bacterial [Actinomycetota bacterium]|jgi:ABC-type multidrug transport system fused ATPase/permease subunit
MAVKFPLASSIDAWKEAKDLVQVPRSRVWLVSVLGAGVGITESIFLAIIASVGVAIAGKHGGQVKLAGFGAISGISVPVLLGIGVALGAVTMVASFLIQIELARINTRTMAEMRRELYDEFTKTSWPAMRGEVESALITYIINHVPRVSNMLTSIVSQLTAFITLVIFLAFALIVAPLVAIAIIVLGVVLYFIFLPMRGIAAKSGEDSKVATRVLFMSFADSVAASREIKTYGVGEPVRQRISREIDDLERPQYRLRLVQGFLPILYQRAVFMILLAGLGIVYAVHLKDLGSIGAALLIVLRAMQQAQLVQSAEPSIAEARPWIAELVNRRDRYRANAFVFGTNTLDAVEEIEFENVSYRYEVEGGEAPLALDNVSFKAHRGELIGVIGPSGSGKSTLTELILRLDKPHTGTYRINGRDTWEFSEESWTEQIVLVPQFSHLIAASVEENIRFLREGITRDAVEDSAVKAHLTEEILELDHGFETLIGERGHRGLSGGQRQRLSIARAIVRPPSLIVLDEPTSALDHKAEDVIVETIERLREHALVIVVAHRLSTLRHCDRVLVLRDGKREAFCKLDELNNSSEFFREARATNAL